MLVLSKEAFADIGGPEYDAFVNSKGGDIKAVANVIDRGDVYLVAKKGLEPTDKNFSAYLKGSPSPSRITGRRQIRLFVILLARNGGLTSNPTLLL